MPKQKRRIHQDEDKSKKLHMEMNMKVGPTRLDPLSKIPTYVVIDIDPVQQQVNRLAERAEDMERRQRRRAWRKK